MSSATTQSSSTYPAKSLTDTLKASLRNPLSSPRFDFHGAVNELLADVGLTAADSGGKLTFFGQDPIVPSCFKFGAMAAVCLAARSVAVAALWKLRTGESQDIHVDVRKALRRFSGFFEGKWETINGRSPLLLPHNNPFFELPLFRRTRDGRHVVVLNIYPKLLARGLNFLRCTNSSEAVSNAILQWRAQELESAAAEAGLVFAMVRTNDEFLNEPQYTEVLSTMPLITVEKIGESDPVPFKRNPSSPLDGIRAFGLGHVIAGAGIGRDLAYYGADVLNIWRPDDDPEIEAFAWDVQTGMRSTLLDGSHEDRAKFDHLLKDADVFFANRRPGYLERYGLTAEELCQKKPGLIHAKVVLHGEKGPWSNRVGFDEIGAAVSGLFAIEGSPTQPQSPPIIPISDNAVGWLGTIGVLEALRRRSVEGGSYRVVVSLTRTVLWLLSMGIFDKTYAKETANSTEEHKYVPPDLFTAETPLGTYQGMTDQIVMSRTQGKFTTVMAPRGSSKPEWLP